MARSTAEQRLYDELLDRYGRRIADAFLAAVNDLRRNADLQAVIAAVEAGDVEAAIRALHLDPAAYNGLLDEIRAAYQEGGKAAAANMPKAGADGAKLVFRFDGHNPAAESYLQDYAATLVTRLAANDLAVVRGALVSGMQRGANPRATALDIVGRLNRATGKREGGVLGLTMQQAAAVEKARVELSGADPEALRNYLSRGPRDKRFDRTVQKALREGKPVSPDVARKAVVGYERGLLRRRGEAVARTETLRALNVARDQAYQQAVESGAFPASAVRKVWQSAADRRVRDTHRAMNSDSVGLREAFTSPSGARLMFPGDPSAPAEEIINCRCIAAYRVDFLANLR